MCRACDTQEKVIAAFFFFTVLLGISAGICAAIAGMSQLWINMNPSMCAPALEWDVPLFWERDAIWRTGSALEQHCGHASLVQLVPDIRNEGTGHFLVFNLDEIERESTRDTFAFTPATFDAVKLQVESSIALHAKSCLQETTTPSIQD